MRRLTLLFVAFVLAHSALGTDVEARGGGRGIIRNIAVLRQQPEYLDGKWFGVGDPRPVNELSSKPPNGTIETLRIGSVSATGLNCSPSPSCSIGLWAYYEPTDNVFARQLLVSAATEFKKRGVKRVLMAYVHPPLWALRGNRYEVIADIPVGADVTIPAPGNVLRNGQQVAIVCGVGSALPTGLACDVAYNVCNRTSSSFQLSTSASSCASASLVDTSGTPSKGTSIVLGRSMPNLVALDDYIRDVVQSWAANGIEVYAYEGPNEPNGSIFWQPEPWVDTISYDELIATQKTIYEAIKKYSPKTKVFLAPVSSVGFVDPVTSACSGGGTCLFPFLGTRGMFTYVDVIAVHAYPAEYTSKEFWDKIVAHKAWLRSHGAGNKKLAVTEYGLYSSNGTDTAGMTATYVAQRLFLLAAAGIESQFPYSWGARGTMMTTTTPQSLIPATGDGKTKIFNFTSPTDPAFFVESSTGLRIFLNDVETPKGWTFTPLNTVTFDTAPGAGVTVKSTQTQRNYGWEQFNFYTGVVNPYGTAYLTIRSRLLGFVALDKPVFSGDVAYVDFRDKHGRRLRAVWSISGASGSHTVPEWGAKYTRLDGTDTVVSAGSSIGIDGNPKMIESR